MRFLALFISAILLASCGSEKPKRDGDTVTLLLNWYPEAEHGGFYAADVHGIYKDAGLTVEILPGGVDVPVIQMVDTGKAMFGVTNADDLLIARAQGADVVALMAPIQDSPRCLLVHPHTGITSFEQLRGITLAMSSRAPFSHFLRHRLPLEGVQIVGYPGSVAPLVAGRIQAMQGYNFSEPFVAESSGLTPVILMVSDLGYNPYTSVLFTTTGTLNGNPELCRRMVEASIGGWGKYIAEPEETNRRINSLNPDMSMEILEFGVGKLRPLVTARLLHGVGQMDHARWETLKGQLEEIGQIPKDSVDLDEVYFAGFLRE